MIVSFEPPVPTTEVDQYLHELEDLLVGSGHVTGFTARHHIGVPGEDAPVFVATAIVQLDLADVDALQAAFTMPGLEEFIGRWQSRHPYRAVWANHEPLD